MFELVINSFEPNFSSKSRLNRSINILNLNSIQDRLPKSPDDPPVKCEGGNYFRVCYSCHSSLSELQDFVRYFQPKKIVPCDMPKDMKYEEVQFDFHFSEETENVKEIFFSFVSSSSKFFLNFKFNFSIFY